MLSGQIESSSNDFSSSSGEQNASHVEELTKAKLWALFFKSQNFKANR